ncbi:MAG: hypothetical protein KDD50_01355 [Bdellovibrionales bacterium]|nr:hypothetical protein [Bdellovibrionales bacterium]
MKSKILNGLETLHLDQSANKAVILLHGYGANMHDLFPLHSYLQPSNIKIDWFFPDAPLEIPLSPFYSGKAWFPIEVGRFQNALVDKNYNSLMNHVPDGLDTARTLLHNFMQPLLEKYNQVILGGFSQGSMLALDYMYYYNAPIKALSLLSTSFINKTKWQSSSFVKMSIFQSHGLQDEVLPFEIAEKIHDHLTHQNHKVDFFPFRGGHEIPLPIIEKLKTFISLQLQ